MAIQLRPYQQDLLDRVRSALDGKPSAQVMLQLPTGGGKTHIAGELLSGWLKDGRKAVWVTHRKELADQTEGMLREAGVSATAKMQWVPGDDAPEIVTGVVILMVQTVGRRTAKKTVWGCYTQSDLMIIDEAHHATAPGYERAIEQWPGPVLGMTATPWRLSEKEGFDHLFEELHCGPQVADLQSNNHLCLARVRVPPEEERIQGGLVDDMGDYSESGIESANEGSDIWTAGALRYWQQHGEDRKTVVYAVSVGHADNLVTVFNDAGIPTRALLGHTSSEDRARLIGEFKRGDLRALVNVAVATEGFDLPDAACVVLARPTMSLALYLQMVGRGLRPKPDCIILDLAGNSLLHGLPEEEREWSLQARGAQPPGEAPVVRCDKCESLSPAASHQCNGCRESFGEPCARCGAWRAWKRWSQKTACGPAHDLVCDLCHYDAHIQARLRVPEDLKELAKLKEDDELSPYRDPFLKNLLEEERRRVAGSTEDRKDELHTFIEIRESELQDDNELNKLFERHLGGLPEAQQPRNSPQRSRLYVKWEGGLKRELEEWRRELAILEAQPVNRQLVFNNARDDLIRLFEAEAREAGLFPMRQIRADSPQSYPSSTRRGRDLKAIFEERATPEDRAYLSELQAERDAQKTPKLKHRVAARIWHAQTRVANGRAARPGTPRHQEDSSLDSFDASEWITFAQLADWSKGGAWKGAPGKPYRLRGPQGEEKPVNTWIDLFVETSEWLIREELLTGDRCPVNLGTIRTGQRSRYFLNVEPTHADGRSFENIKPLGNGIYLEANRSVREIARYCGLLVEKFGKDPAQFHVQLR